jgi:hypothetical protein
VDLDGIQRPNLCFLDVEEAARCELVGRQCRSKRIIDLLDVVGRGVDNGVE